MLRSTSSLIATAPRHGGHPVLVPPGLLMGDTATKLLRTLGHNVSGWRLGSNRGATSEVVQGLRTRLERPHRESG